MTDALIWALAIAAIACVAWANIAYWRHVNSLSQDELERFRQEEQEQLRIW